MNPARCATLGLLIIGMLAGCLDAAPAAALPANEAPSTVAAFPPKEHDLMVRYFVMSTVVPVYVPAPGNEGSWSTSVPEGADNVTLNATWSASTPAATIQHCMIHAAKGDKPGPMLGEKKGPSPLTVPRTVFPNATKAIVVMCMPMNEPVAAEVMQMIHLKLEFTRGAKA